jgi:hypothetical protein
MKPDLRFYNPNDIDDLVQFWNENGGWDVIDRNEWEKRFYNTPEGPSSIVIALDESQKIIGQFIFIPTKVRVGNEIVKAFRPQAPVVQNSVRATLGIETLIDYISSMYKLAIEKFIQEQVYLIFMLPDRRWAHAFKFFKGAYVHSFPLWSFSLNNSQMFSLPASYTIETIKADDKRIDQLWRQSSEFFECSPVRDSSVLPWKLSLKDFSLVGIVHQERLTGVVASLYSEPDKQWLICDILAENEEALEVTIKAACNQAIKFRDSLPPFNDTLRKVAILATPKIEKVISRLQFYKDIYDFSVVIHILDPESEMDKLNPQRWYLTAND